jgi:hypothetical protein
MTASLLGPQTGDILLRGSFDSGFELLDPQTSRPLIGGRHSISAAIAFAREHQAPMLWQLNTDERGRTLGEPLRLPLRS